jgi:hypothetical protein
MSRDGRVRSGSIVFPILLIAVGFLFLLWRWLPDFDPWPVIWKYWPLLLILMGGGMFWDRMQSQRNPGSAPAFPVGSTIGTVVFLLVLSFLLWRGFAFEGGRWTDWGKGINVSASRGHESKAVELGAAKAVRMNVEMPAGELRLEGGSPKLLEADFFHSGSWGAPEVNYGVNAGVGQLTINQEKGGQMIGNTDNTWNLKVSDATPLELKVDVGAGRGDFRLAKVNLTRLELNIGAGQANVDLTGERAKDLEATIQGGVGEAVVRLPKNIGVIATVHGGLGSVDVHGLKEEDDKYVNAAYGKAPSTIRLTVEGGIGHIKLEQE